MYVMVVTRGVSSIGGVGIGKKILALENILIRHAPGPVLV